MLPLCSPLFKLLGKVQIVIQSFIFHYFLILSSNFFPLALTGNFHRSLNDSKSFQQFSWTFPSILASFNSAVIWIVSILSLVSSFPNVFLRFLVTVLQTLIMIGISVTFMSHNFFSSLARFSYLLSFSLYSHSIVF